MTSSQVSPQRQQHELGGTEETGEIPQSERAVGEDGESEDNDSPCGHPSTWSCDPRDSGVALEDPRNSWDPRSEECSARNSEDVK